MVLAGTAGSVMAQSAGEGLLEPLVAAVARGDSAEVRRTLADTTFRTALEAAEQTGPLLHSLGQTETLDGDLRRDAFREAIVLAQGELLAANEGPSRADRSTALYDIYADYVDFLERDFLLHLLAEPRGSDRETPAPFAAVTEGLAEINQVYSSLHTLLPPCSVELACAARRNALFERHAAFRNGPLAGVVALVDDAVRAEQNAYRLFEAENTFGQLVRSYQASRESFAIAAALYGEAAARVKALSPGHLAADRLSAYRNLALQRSEYAARVARERGDDRDDRPVEVPTPVPPAPPPPYPPSPPSPPPPPPPMLNESNSLATIAQAQNPDLLTSYQRTCLASSPETPLSAGVALYYATSRRPVARRDPARDLYFGTRREAFEGDRIRLNYGRAMVNVPCQRDRGALPRPLSVFIFQLEPVLPKKHFYLHDVSAFADEAEWLGAIDGAVAPTRRREVLVYVHGYNNGFSAASYRAAQLHADLGIDGATVFYSWASQERLLGYGRDRDTVEDEAEISALADTLIALRNSEATTVYLVAHSMGNRLMMAALEEIAARSDRPARNFNELVLGSADIEKQAFEEHWIGARTVVDRATLYASSQDRAMWAARLFAGDRRIGDANPQPLVFQGMRTIDTSAVGGSGLGHDDYSQGGLTNVQASVWFGLQPEARCILTASAGPPTTTYWSILPEQSELRGDCTHASFSDAVAVARLTGSFSEAFEWMNQVYPMPEDPTRDDSYADRIRRVIRNLIGRR